jgi:hypothetical protein
MPGDAERGVAVALEAMGGRLDLLAGEDDELHG